MAYRVSFFRHNDRDMIEIRVVGDPNSVVRKKRPDDETKFPAEWRSYQNNGEAIDWGGTPLTALEASPGVKVSKGFAVAMAQKGIHNAELLAALPDIAAKALGMGVVTLRNTARKFLDEQEKAAIAAAVKAAPAPEPDEDEEAEPAPKPRRARKRA